LNKRLNALAGNNPFVETRGWSDTKAHTVSAKEFDFLDIPPYTDRNNSESVKLARVALTGNPFI